MRTIQNLAENKIILGRWLIHASLILTCALSTLWQLWEQDIFWQIRAGDELWRGLGLQSVDQWSLTGSGQPWLNIQWLSTLLLRAVHWLADIPGLVIFRAATVFVILLICWTTLRKLSNPKDSDGVLLTVLLVFATISFRAELRSDLFVFVVASLLVQVWMGAWQANRKIAATIGLIVVGSNLHTGTAPFLILMAGGFIGSDHELKWRWKILVGLTSAAALLLNPYHMKILPVLWEHLDYSKYYVLENSDHLPLSFNPRLLGIHGLAAWFWLLTTALGWLGLLHSERQRFRSKWPLFVVGLLLCGLSINRMRAIPYQIIFFLPYIHRGLGEILARISQIAGRRYQLVNTFTLALLIASYAWHHRLYAIPMGLGLDQRIFPVGTANFLSRVKPRPNLYHSYAFGGYFVWHLPAYQTFVDTRQTMFKSMQQVFLAAYSSPKVTQELCKNWDINTAIMPIAQTRYIDGLGYEDLVASYFPYEQWATVYFDDISAVHVRRIAEHTDLIRTFEYQLLKPNIPAQSYLGSDVRTPEKDQRYFAEVQRCLELEPRNLHCALAQSMIWREKGTPLYRELAFELLNPLMEKGRSNSAFLQELLQVAKNLNKQSLVSDLEDQISELSSTSLN